MGRVPGRWLSVALVAVAVVVALGLRWNRGSADLPSATRVVQAKHHDKFVVAITTTGELRARHFVPVEGPRDQSAQLFQTKISWLVPEGTVVQAGDRVAELDRVPAAQRYETVRLDLQKAEAEFTNVSLDSALNLSQAREAVRTADYALEEMRLAQAQARFEAPSLKRQADINYEKAQRAAAQARNSLDIKTRQATAKLVVSASNVERQRRNLTVIQEATELFTVRAPSSGMVIYIREFGGRRKGVGSNYYVFDPGVATLPDLTRMQSQTYVNEVDIKKIAVGQDVTVSIDADPSRRLAGQVVSVANVGEQRLNQDAKVFEVLIDLAGADTALRPAMTSANRIEVATFPNVLTVPLEAVVADSGSSYVYKQTNGTIVRQMVKLGATNEVDVVVLSGLTRDDHVMLGLPKGFIASETIKLPR